MKKIGIIGIGNIGSAIVRCVAPRSEFFLQHCDIDQALADALAEETGSESVPLDRLLETSDIIVLAVKPQVLPSLYSRLSETTGKAWISMAAGITLDTLRTHLKATSIARIMPNIAASIGRSITAIAFTPQSDASFRADAEKLIGSFGTVFPLDEGLFGAFTAISGSAIAAVFQFLNGMALGGVKEGLSYRAALDIIAETCLSAVHLVKESGIHPEQLASQVCSPGGTAIEMIALLENRSFKGTLIDCIGAASRRSRTLEANVR